MPASWDDAEVRAIIDRSYTDKLEGLAAALSVFWNYSVAVITRAPSRIR
jgi:hypothetical protein